MNLRQHLKRLGYRLVDDTYYSSISYWKAWYRGKVASFHDYKIYNAGREIRRTRSNLNMAKQGCETWANLLWNYECGITVESDPDADAILQDVLQANNFWDQTNRLTEQAFALGTGAYIVFADSGKPSIDYVTADYIFPLSWHRGEIESCAFAAQYTSGSNQLVYLMIHEKPPDGSYRIKNRFFQQREYADQLSPTDVPPGIQPEYTSRTKRFAIVTPNIANNLADVPMGLSVYGNCIDTLKNIDLAYDGITVSMELGRPRVGVTGSMMKVEIDPTDMALVPIFDAKDISVYELGTSMNDVPVDVKDLTVQYRAKEFEESLQTQLDIYSQNIGLGDKAFKWDKGSVMTATQVVSDNSAMLRTMEKHQESLRVAVVEVARAILDLSGHAPDAEIAVFFDDSVTRDKNAERERAWQWVVLGRFPFWRYLVDFEGYDEPDAKALERDATSGMAAGMPAED